MTLHRSYTSRPASLRPHVQRIAPANRSRARGLFALYASTLGARQAYILAVALVGRFVLRDLYAAKLTPLASEVARYNRPLYA